MQSFVMTPDKFNEITTCTNGMMLIKGKLNLIIINAYTDLRIIIELCI
jgi:hypothetical protein